MEKQEDENIHLLDSFTGSSGHVIQFSSMRWAWELLGRTSRKAFKTDRWDWMPILPFRSCLSPFLMLGTWTGSQKQPGLPAPHCLLTGGKSSICWSHFQHRVYCWKSNTSLTWGLFGSEDNFSAVLWGLVEAKPQPKTTTVLYLSACQFPLVIFRQWHEFFWRTESQPCECNASVLLIGSFTLLIWWQFSSLKITCHQFQGMCLRSRTVFSLLAPWNSASVLAILRFRI